MQKENQFRFIYEDNVLNKYDVFLIDLWGVIYDGYKLYPDVIKTLEYLHEREKKIIFFSNAPRRKTTIQSTLESFFIKEHLYNEIVSSGELVYYVLQKQRKFGEKYFHVGNPLGEEVLSHLNGYEKVMNPEEATFAILTSTLDYYDEALSLAEKAKKYDLPLLCVNPDKLSITYEGKEILCPGVIAGFYEKWGGKVVYFGKPYIEMYDYALRLLDDKSKVLAIGDSIFNDIKGANNYGIDSLFITAGIHRNELNVKMEEYPERKITENLFNKHNIYPTYVANLLRDMVK